MILNKILKKAAPHVPVVGSAYGFVKTCVRVSSASTPAGAVVQGCKGIIINCIPPTIKYPALCAAALGCTVQNPVLLNILFINVLFFDLNLINVNFKIAIYQYLLIAQNSHSVVHD
jgi:hypothetical protein